MPQRQPEEETITDAGPSSIATIRDSVAHILLRYDTLAAAKLDIVDWIGGFYNHRRMHSSLGDTTPVGAESGLMAVSIASAVRASPTPPAPQGQATKCGAVRKFSPKVRDGFCTGK